MAVLGGLGALPSSATGDAEDSSAAIASSGFDTYPPEFQARLLEYPAQVPLQRYGTESEISAAITYLLSPAAAYVTGTCLRVDGGAPNRRQTWTGTYEATNVREFNGFHRTVKPKVLGG